MKSLIALALFLPAVCLAAQPEFKILIKDHRFEPARLTVPGNTKFKLLVHNQDATPEEFESYELDCEKIIAGGASATIYINALKPGRYPFFGEFNQATAQGVVIVE